MMATGESKGPWARKAEALYDDAYARKYRDRDDALLEERSYQNLISWLQQVCGRFHHRIDVLDLGCGTGRYFWGVRRVKTLTGLDASQPMLAEAKMPTHADRIGAERIALVHGDLAAHRFPANSFDLVYSIGVLAEHVPLNRPLVERVAGWLRPGGRFAFTTVDPQSPDVPRTPARRLASALLPMVPGQPGRRLHERLMVGGMYGDARWIRSQLHGVFSIESLEQYQSDVHLHGRCVARKA